MFLLYKSQVYFDIFILWMKALRPVETSATTHPTTKIQIPGDFNP